MKIKCHTFPGDIYEFDFWVQDLDHEGLVAMDEISVTIVHDPKGLFQVIDSNTTRTNDVCADYEDKELEALSIDFQTLIQIPQDIGDRYNITLEAWVSTK